jgi:tryptophan synthase alpha chain
VTPPEPGRVGAAFGRAAAERRGALVGYLPAGFPSVDGAIAAATAMARAGADVESGVRVSDVLRTVEAVSAAGVPVLVMTYWNPVDRYGVGAFARDLASVGGCGMITPDLPPEEAGPWLDAAAAYGLDPVFLVAPSSPDERIKLITAACGGFVYAASVMGITGARAAVGDAAAGLVQRVRQFTKLPVAVGVGVSTAAQAAEVARYADGVIVGSALVQRLLGAPDAESGCAAVAALTADLAAGVRGRP